MKRSLTFLAVLAAVLVLSGGKAEASSFSQRMSLGGFTAYLSGSEFGDESWANFQLDSPIHEIGGASADFYTRQDDPSEWVWSVYVDGRKDTPPTTGEITSGLSFNTDEVSFHQNTGRSFDSNNGYNYAWASMWVTPASMDWGYAYYNEHQTDSGIIKFNWNFVVFGSFGPGEEGDRRGAPFVQTPEPGALALMALGGVAALRRRRSA